MARYLFRLPDIGEGVAEAEIVAWHVKPGEIVREDQNLADVMTDKATVEMTSPVDGIVKSIHGDIGSMLAVGALLCELEVPGGDESEPSAPHEHAPTLADDVGAAPVLPHQCSEESGNINGAEDGTNADRGTPHPANAEEQQIRAGARVRAAPAVRRRALSLGLELESMQGSGPNGRITALDVDAHAALLQARVRDRRYVRREGLKDRRIVGLRRKIAEKMVESKRRIPHITYVEEIDVTEIETLRQFMNAERQPDQPKLTFLPFLVRALARTIPDYPEVNARFDDVNGLLRAYDALHVGIATQTPGGLMVPVVRHAEALDLWDIASEIARLSATSRSGGAARQELTGSTITITSLGPLGGISTAPVINHPEVAIIGPNKIVERPVISGHFVAIRKIMNLSCAFDHRVIDGYDAALFVQRIKRLIEHPALIFMD